MTWDPTYTQRISLLVTRRGLTRDVADALYTAADPRLLAELEATTDDNIAEVCRLWRESSTQQGGTS